jgi:hypothetical protein
MPGVRQVIGALATPLRAAGDTISRTINDVRSQAPGARMIGEFAVRTGLSRVEKKFRPGKPDQG